MEISIISWSIEKLFEMLNKLFINNEYVKKLT
jgi:hypothetical protein